MKREVASRSVWAHRGARAVERLQAQWPQIVLVDTPIHASWLNRIESAGTNGQGPKEFVWFSPSKGRTLTTTAALCANVGIQARGAAVVTS